MCNGLLLIGLGLTLLHYYIRVDVVDITPHQDLHSAVVFSTTEEEEDNRVTFPPSASLRFDPTVTLFSFCCHIALACRWGKDVFPEIIRKHSKNAFMARR